MSRDVRIVAPVAVANGHGPLPTPPEVSPQELCQLQAARIRELELEVENQRVAASTMANIVACSVQRVIDLRPMPSYREDQLLLPRSLVDRMDGAKVALDETGDRDIIVTITERMD